MKELSALLTVALSLVILSACGMARGAFAPDDMAIAERVSVTLQRITGETSVSVQAERHGNRLDYTIQGDAPEERTLILAAWYDADGRMLGASRRDNGTISVEDGAHMYRVFLLDAASYEPLCRAWNSETDSRPASMPQTGWTAAVPAAYMLASGRPGTVERLDYDTKDYAHGGGDIRKTAYVYLPYGYDAEDAATRYDIVYLMHGWGGSAGECFNIGTMKETFDNLMEKGDMKPSILVSATFYNENSNRDFSGSIAELRAFHNDFVNALMPAVEGKYRTYANSTSPEDLKASRDHRAFGGFSLGSVTTWMAFCYDYDYIRYFAPMSGSCWYHGTYGDFQTVRNVDFIENLVREQNLDERGYFIYHAVGTLDSVKSQTLMQAEEMLARGNVFTPDHYVFYQKDGGYHDMNAVQEYLYNALPLFFPGGKTATPAAFSAPVTEGATVGEVKSLPAFGDFGRLLFPVDRNVSDSYTLADVSTSGVYVWYNNIRAEKTAEIVNYLKEQAESGKRVFYPIYSETEMDAYASKRDTGLFFFRGNDGAPFAVCNAGGGFVYVGAMHDSFPHALELSKKGYNAFALIYRPDYAYDDLGRALGFIHDHAEELGVNPDGYSLWGGSAGARMAATLGNADGLRRYTGRADIPQAAAVVMQYTGYSSVSRADAPTYANCGTRDGIASWRTMESRLNALSAYGIPTEFHAYEGLPHGFGIGTGTVAENWIDDAIAFWEARRQAASL